MFLPFLTKLLFSAPPPRFILCFMRLPCGVGLPTSSFIGKLSLLPSWDAASGGSRHFKLLGRGAIPSACRWTIGLYRNRKLCQGFPSSHSHSQKNAVCRCYL
ncbi:hypothetical protein JB92DRAFT_2891209, partial [Gautieria morchelliformis]